MLKKVDRDFNSESSD